MKSDWCYSSDGEAYTECETARSREEAIAEAIAEGAPLGYRTMFIGRVKRFNHEDFVHGIGWRVAEWLREQAEGEVGEHAEDYPTCVKDFETLIEQAVLGVLAQHADVPTFFQAEQVQEISVPQRRRLDGQSPCSLTPEEEAMKLRIEEARDAHREVTYQLGRVLGQCRHPVCGTDQHTLQPACVICGKIMDFA